MLQGVVQDSPVDRVAVAPAGFDSMTNDSFTPRVSVAQLGAASAAMVNAVAAVRREPDRDHPTRALATFMPVSTSP